MNDQLLIVGITGQFGSGKSTAAIFLQTKGFRRIYLASFLEEEIEKKGFVPITRKHLQDMGNELREKYGGGVLVKKALELAKKGKYKKIVIDGIRNIEEIKLLQKNGNFTLLAIVSDKKVRFERLKKNKRREDLTWDEFDKLDKKDLGIGQSKTGLQVAICVALSDIFIENNTSLVNFQERIEQKLFHLL